VLGSWKRIFKELRTTKFCSNTKKSNEILHFSTLKALTNFVWETVDPSRVEADNAELLSVLGSLSGGMTGGHVTTTTQLVDCDCDTDPECVCEEEEEEEDIEEEEEEETEEEEEMEEETEGEEEKEIEKRQDDDRPAKYETAQDDEVDLLELQDESEINYQRKAAALERKIELLEDLLESETEEEEQETLRSLLEKAWSELESLEEEGGEEVLGEEALAVLKAQIEEDDKKKKAKDEL
jgi:hypothetical protein